MSQTMVSGKDSGLHAVPTQVNEAKTKTNFIGKVTAFIHHHFLLILIGAYLAAAFVPGPGQFIRDVSFGRLAMPGAGSINISPSLLMLSFLLFNAGLGIKLEEIKHLAKKPALTVAGFLANTLVPLALIFLCSGAFANWHNPEEVQNLLIGLALIFSMPIAGSSTAWSQNANGNLALSLGLVLLSTILSPLLTPITLSGFSVIANNHYAADLKLMASQGTNAFMCLTVVLPSILGIACNYLLSKGAKAKLAPMMKLVNYGVLLTLNYSNASTALPTVLPKLDLDFITLLVLSTSLLCSFAFAAGWAISKMFKANKADMAALMFGLGMNNNGTGLVLAGAMLADHPQVMLPLIFYTLFQQVIAAIVDRILFKGED